MSDPSIVPIEVPKRHGAWSSGLSTNDFAACVESGLEPLGFVQGVSVVNWNFVGMGRTLGMGMGGGLYGGYNQSGYAEQFNCPHGFVSAEHRLYGVNFEKNWIEDAWAIAYQGALKRLVDEATELGAAGVIGVTQRAEFHAEQGAYEFFLSGTAVGMDGVAPPPQPFTTFLAGQKLVKLLEAGFAPVSIVMTLASVGVYASCVTEFQLNGGANWGWGGMSGEIDQVSRAHGAARSLARERIRRQLGGDSLLAAQLSVHTREVGGQGPQIEVTLKGDRVRRFKDFEDIPAPRPVLSLVDR